MAQATKSLPCIWSRVFRVITTRCKNDLEIQRAVGSGLRIWDNNPLDKTPFIPTDANTVQVRLTPLPRNVQWWSPDSQLGQLVVKTEIAVQSLDITDYMDVWDLVVNTMRPSDQDLKRALVAAGAHTGECLFGDPAVDTNPDMVALGYFIATGNFQLDIRRTVYNTATS